VASTVTDASIVLIASGAYVDTELAAEFGQMPPAFLPVGHHRLYELQLRSLSHLPGRRLLSLPESFDIPAWDSDALLRSGVEVVRVPDGLKLGESILYALQIAGDTGCEVRILHGDTIIYDLTTDIDIVAAGTADTSYVWGAYKTSVSQFASTRTDPTDRILAGFFAFSDDVALRRALARARGDFVLALNHYKAERSLALGPVDHWLDFGHLQTFYRSRCSVRTQRAFNDLEVTYRAVQKTSRDREKMDAEAHWFETLPYALRTFAPPYLGRRSIEDRPGYAIEYLPTPSLHELFAFGRLEPGTWAKILESGFEFMNACAAIAYQGPEIDVMGELALAKTVSRLEAFERATGVPAAAEWRYDGRPMPSLLEIATSTASEIRPSDATVLGVMHGDFCFTNIFYDHRRQQIRTIDPRGMVQSGHPTIYGDVRYDLAKLNHSVSGFYDLILTDRYRCSGFQDYDLRLEFSMDSAAAFLPDLAADFRVAGLGIRSREISALTIHLFLSMLPLHADSPARQQAFVANAVRLYSKDWGRSL